MTQAVQTRNQQKTGRFVNVTNRPAFSVESGIVAILRTALDSDDKWVSAVEHDQIQDPESLVTEWHDSPVIEAKVGLFPNLPSAKQDHYTHISLGLLWPLMHEMENRSQDALSHMTSGADGSIAFDTILEALEARAENYKAYIDRMSDALNEMDLEGKICLVHDFTCAGARAEKAKANVYTVHTPFPSAAFLERIHVDQKPLADTIFFRDFMSSMLSYDLITMHTDKDVQNFCDIVRRVDPDAQIDAYGRIKARIGGQDLSSVVKKVHVGIDPNVICQEADNAVLKPETVEKFIEPIQGRTAVLSVARHDYTKGTIELAESIDRYFTANPDQIGNVSFVVIRQPSRNGLSGQTEYQEAANRLFEDLKERYGDAVIFENEGMSHAELMYFMRLPNVKAITSLPSIHEGHDLTVREFVDINPEGSKKAVLATRGVGAMSVLGVPGQNGEEAGAFKVDACDDHDSIVRALEEILDDQYGDQISARFDAMKERSSLFSGRKYLDTIEMIVNDILSSDISPDDTLKIATKDTVSDAHTP